MSEQSTVDIRETEGFKLFYQEHILPRINNQPYLMSVLTSDLKQDQILLPDNDSRSHVYQYKAYLQNKQ